MKRIITILSSLILSTTLTTIAAYGQKTPSISPQDLPPASPQPAMDRKANKEEIRDFDIRKLDEAKLLPMFLLIITLGGIGGVVFELINLQGNVEWPHKPSDDELAAKLAYATPKNVIDLGILARIIVGAAAAPPAMLFVRPESAFALIAMSVVAGSAGTAVFRALQDRLLLVVAQKEKGEKEQQYRQLIDMVDKTLADLKQGKPEEAAESLKKAKEFRESLVTQEESKQAASQTNLEDKVDEAINAFQNLKNKLIKASNSPEGQTKLQFNGGKGFWSFLPAVSLEQEDLDKIKKLLGEIKHPYQKIVSPNDSSNQKYYKIEEAIDAFNVLRENIIKNSSRPDGKTTLQLTKGAFLEQKELDKVENLLSELKGNLRAGGTSARVA